MAKIIPSLLLILGLSACSSDSQQPAATATEVTDSLGTRFGVDCSSGLCVLKPIGSTVVANACSGTSGTDVFALIFDPLLSIYAVHISASGTSVELNGAEASHPVRCETDANCLPSGITLGGGSYSYTCRGGLCLLQNSCYNGTCVPWDGALMTYDVLTLCQADLLWPTQCPYITSLPYAARIEEVATLCGPTKNCNRVPADCLQLPPLAGIDGGTSEAGP